MMTKDFEKYFPLPWHIEEEENGPLRTLCPASGKAFMDFGIIEGPLDFDGYDVQEYLVQCANLMPEAVEIIKPLIEICKDSCALCAVESRANATKCKCSIKRTIEQAEALLAKLEGGAEDERD